MRKNMLLALVVLVGFVAGNFFPLLYHQGSPEDWKYAALTSFVQFVVLMLAAMVISYFEERGRKKN